MAEVSRIIIKVAEKEIPLTLEEAKELRRVLDDLFGASVIVNPQPIVVSPPVIVPYPYRWEPYKIWCGTTDDTGTYTITASSARVSLT